MQRFLESFFTFYGYEDFSSNGDILFEAGLFALIFIGAGFYFKNAHEKLSNETSSARESMLNLESLDELNFQRVPVCIAENV